MNSLIDFTLQNTLKICTDLSDENCVFITFETDDKKFAWSDGLQSSGRFGRILYRRPNGNLEYSDHLVLKVTPPRVFMKCFSLVAFFNEVFFYTRILPFFATYESNIDRLFPKYYNSILQYNVAFDDVVMVFENLQAKGYTSATQKSFLDFDHLKLMMRAIGEFHAHSYLAREKTPDKFRALARSAPETNGFILRQYPDVTLCLMRSFEPLSAHPYYGAKLEKIRRLVENYNDIASNALVGDENNRAHVLCHGDFIRNNVLFKYEQGKPTELKLIDLAAWRFASPALDLASVLYLNADQKMRNENWNNLIDEYCVALGEVFPAINVPSKKEILTEFETQAINAYFTASYFLPALIADDNDDVPQRNDLLPTEYRNSLFSDIPRELQNDLCTKLGGHRATTALIDVLKDIVDRGFAQ